MAVSSALARNRVRDVAVVTGVLLFAAGVGILTAEDPKLGIAVCAAAIAVPAAIFAPHVMPHVLVVTVFANTITVGGVTVGRLAGPLAVIAVASRLLQRPAQLRNARLVIALTIGYSLLAFASLIWSVDFRASLGALAALGISIAYGAAFAILVRDERDLRRLLWVITVSSIALAALWIVSYETGIDRRFNEAGDPNLFAALQVVALPLVLVLASSAKTSAQRLWLYGAMGVIAASIISTLSRGGLLTLLLAGLIITALPAPALFRSRAQKAGFFLATALGLVLLAGAAWEDLSHRFEVGFADENAAGGRGDLWLAAMNGYEQHPVTGLGYGGFQATSFQLLRTTPGVELESHLRFLDTGEYVHNAYLGSLAELGPLGFCLFVGIYVAVARSLLRAAREAAAAGDSFRRLVANALLVGLLAFCVSSLLLSTETSRTFWMIVGLSTAVAGMRSTSIEPAGRSR